MHTIKQRIRARTTAERCYNALASAQGVRQWWTTDAEMDERVNGIARFWFYDRSLFTQIRIDEMIPNRRVVWDVEYSAIPELKGTLITFDISESGDEVTLDFTESGFQKAEVVHAIFSSGWYLYLSSLRQYLETGVGHPHPFIDFVHPANVYERAV
jgi:uncharacterized protein YndB with AHSA1/START domain